MHNQDIGTPYSLAGRLPEPQQETATEGNVAQAWGYIPNFAEHAEQSG
jgi:hypothetical protein